MLDTVIHLLNKSVNSNPDRDAVVYNDQRITYSQLWNTICSVSKYLLTNGIKRGDRVAILNHNSPEYIAIYYGILATGGIAVGLNTSAKYGDINNWLTHCDAKYIFANVNHSEFEYLTAEKLSVIGINYSDEAHKHTGDLWTDVVNCPAEEPMFLVDYDIASPAMIMYTSGTSGSPKGVTISHKNLTSNIQSIISYLGLTHNDSIVSGLPFYYSYGNSVMNTHLSVGAKLVLENNFVYPHKFIEKMVEESVTGFSGVPSTYSLLLSRTNLKNYNLSKLRYMTQAGGAMAPTNIIRILDAIPRIDFYVMYGQTEATARLSYLEPNSLDAKMGSIGKAIPGVTLSILDENDNICPPGVIGEICAKGDNVMIGYWNDPIATTNVIKNGWLRTGDLARYDDDGYIYIEGRSSDMIKTGANRISPKEIEEVIAQLLEVEEVAVVGVPDEMLGQIIKAVIVTTPDSTLKKKNILSHCRKYLSTYKIPKSIEFAYELPKTASGKIQRYLLKKDEHIGF